MPHAQRNGVILQITNRVYIIIIFSGSKLPNQYERLSQQQLCLENWRNVITVMALVLTLIMSRLLCRDDDDDGDDDDDDE